MSPIPGIIASQITGHLSTNSFESIATVTVGSGGQSSISFSSIPSTYKHLQIRCLARTSAAVSDDAALVTFNSDSGANYSIHNLRGNGGAAFAGAVTSANFVSIQRFTGGSATASMYGVGVLDLLDYTNTSKYKTVRQLGGFDTNGGGNIYFNSGLWISTSAVTSMAIVPSQGGNWEQYSSFALYGVH